VSREGDQDPHVTSQLQAADQGVHSSATTTTPKSPSTSRAMRGFINRGGNSSRMAPPAFPPPRQPGHQQRSSLTSSGIHQHQHQHQQPQPGYPTVPVGSMDERYAKHRRVDDGQSPSGFSVAQQQQPIAGYPTQQYHSQTQGHWYGGGTQPTNAPMSQPSQPPYGYSPISAGPSHSQYAHPAHAPTRNPSMHAAPTLTAPSQWTNSSSTQGQELYSGPAAYPQLVQMQPYQQQLYISPIHAAGTYSLAEDPSSHVPPYLSQASLTVSGETPDSGVAPGGPIASVGGTTTMGEPTPSNQQIVPNRSDRTNRRQLSKPYQRPTPATRKTRPVTFEGDLVRLQQRCRRQGADEGAIGLLGKVFASEVSLEALTRLLTDEEVDTEVFEVETGRVYITFLETTNEEEGVIPRYICRLCHADKTWKHSRDVLRHLRRDHFGLADVCNKWYVFDHSLTLMSIKYVPRRCSGRKVYTKGEMTSHHCK